MTACARHEVRWMFHSTAMVPDYDRAITQLQAIAGLRVLEYDESLRPQIGRRGGMTWLGDNSLEVGQPIVPSGGAARFVDRSGGGMHSVALQVRDIEATMEHMQANEVDVDPHFGGKLPDVAVEPVLDIREHAFIGALVEDPVRCADQYSQLLGTHVTFEQPGAGPDSPRIGVSLGDCTLALYALAPAQGAGLWGRAYERPRTHLMALRVDDLGAARDALLAADIPIVRADDSAVVLDPGATGGVQTAIVEHLLPGDPRTSP